MTESDFNLKTKCKKIAKKLQKNPKGVRLASQHRRVDLFKKQQTVHRMTCSYMI